MDIVTFHPVIEAKDWGQCSGCQVASPALSFSEFFPWEIPWDSWDSRFMLLDPELELLGSNVPGSLDWTIKVIWWMEWYYRGYCPPELQILTRSWKAQREVDTWKNRWTSARDLAVMFVVRVGVFENVGYPNDYGIFSIIWYEKWWESISKWVSMFSNEPIIWIKYLGRLWRLMSTFSDFQAKSNLIWFDTLPYSRVASVANFALSQPFRTWFCNSRWFVLVKIGMPKLDGQSRWYAKTPVPWVSWGDTSGSNQRNHSRGSGDLGATLCPSWYTIMFPIDSYDIPFNPTIFLWNSIIFSYSSYNVPIKKKKTWYPIISFVILNNHWSFSSCSSFW